MAGREKKSGRCCACAMNGSCKRCSCSVNKVPCTGCVPSKYGRCSNSCQLKVQTPVVHDPVGSAVGRRFVQGNDTSQTGDSNDGQWQDKFVNAYGGKLLGSGGEISLEKWHIWWVQLVSSLGSLYDLPGGNVGKRFVDVLADEISNVVDRRESSERFIVYCRVVLQRDSGVKRSSDVRRLIKRRLDLWSSGNFGELVQEAVRCSSQGVRKGNKGSANSEDHVNKVFTRLMWRGEVRAAARWINGKMSGGVLHPNDRVDGSSDRRVIDVLQEKHPDSGTLNDDVMMNGEFPCLVDVDITGSHIERLARSLHGGGGPGGTNSGHWRSFLLCYGTQSAKLRESVASLARMLANNVVEWEVIRALMASRLIALDKNPGVRPIGVGEVLRRLLGKAMVLATGVDVEELCGADQLCSGLKGGIEGAIHSVNRLFNESSMTGCGVLMVDAKNAFNSINRVAGLWNARYLWPRCSRYLFNTYRGHSSLWINGHPDPLYSKEGVTQGDPLSMCFYAVSLMPLIRQLKSSDWSQTWFADDSSCTGSLSQVKRWFDLLLSEGPKYGYYPEPSKSVLVVREEFFDRAQTMFGDMGVKVTCGSRFLGGFVGDKDGCEAYVKTKVKEWVSSVRRLAKVSKSQPQAAFAALMKSVQHEWSFFQRVVSVCPGWFDDLRNALRSEFWPSLFGGHVSEAEADLFSLPTRLGGMGIRDPTVTSELCFDASVGGSGSIVDHLMGKEMFSVADHGDVFMRACNTRRLKQKEVDMINLDRTLSLFDDGKVRAIRRSIDGKSSNWLNVVPVLRYGFVLAEREFRDAIALRYKRPLVEMRSHCDC